MVHCQPESPPAKRSRASKPKVRTGCQTCKARRVKCDEQKPFCLRCRRLNLECLGYLAPTARRKKNTSIQARPERPRLLVPAGLSPTAPPGRSPRSEQAFLQPQHCHSVPRSVPSHHYQLAEDRDVVYIDYFRFQVANNLAGFYTTSIWSRLVAGEGLQDDFIYHSILAIGAFMRSMTEPPSLCNNPHALMSRNLLNRPINKHQEAALQHHAKATSSFQRRIQYLALYAPYKVVVTTLLLAVFELLKGDLDAANLTVDSSIGVLIGFSPSRTLLSVRPQGHHHEFQEVEWVLPLLSITSQLSHVFRPVSYNIRILQLQMTVNSSLPEPEWDSLAKTFSCWGRFFTFSIVFLQQSLLYEKENSSNSSLDQFIPQQTALLLQLERWQAVLEQCRKGSCLEPSRQIAMRLGQMQWLLLHIALNCCLDSTQVAYDSYEAEFRELCAQCKVMITDGLSHQRPTSVLLGQGIILALSTVIRCCRNHDIRMTATEAAMQIPESMIAWDVQELLGNLLATVLLEEVGRDDSGFIPPQSRWAYLEKEQKHGEHGRQRLERIYQRLAPDQAGTVVRNRLTIASSDLQVDICNEACCRKNHAEP